MPSLLPFLLLASTSTLSASAALVEHWWNISYTTANPNGLGERRVIGVNGTWPPPPVVVTQNDTLRIHVHNGLGPDSEIALLSDAPEIGTGIHTHGNFFNSTSYYDGAVRITQCPIPSGGDMTYDIPTTDQTGTYWIHGHYQGQYVDGLRTPFIIHPLEPRSDNLTWDGEYTLIVADWYQRQWKDLLDNEFLTWTNPTGAEPVPTSAVIYVAQNDSYVHTQADLAKGTGVNNEAVIAFEPGKKYRIRMINMSALAMFHIMFGDHTIRVIEVDGTEVEPFEVDMVSLSVAQRYSIIVEAKNETTSNYPVMLFQDPDMYDVVPEDLVLNNTLTLSYSESNPAVQPFDWTEETYPMMDDTKFVPLIVSAMAPADEVIDLTITFDTYNDGNPRASCDTYSPPITPTYFTALSMGSAANESSVYGTMTNVKVLEHNKNYELKLINTDAGNHPFHLHGHQFQIVGRSANYSEDTAVEENQVNPSRRDTVMVPSGGWTAVRFRADNPGAWIFHCHIEWHMDQGLAMVFVAAPELIQRETPPSYMLDQCSAQGVSPTGNVVGRNSTTDFKGEPYGPWPLTLNWTSKATGAMAGCVLTALCGILAVVWYGWGEINEDEIESEILRKRQLKEEKKQKKKALVKKLTGRK